MLISFGPIVNSEEEELHVLHLKRDGGGNGVRRLEESERVRE